jgi:hypothetical protein
MIDSLYKNPFVTEGVTYWSFYMEITNRGNALKNYTGLFQVTPRNQDPVTKYVHNWDISDATFSKTMEHNIHLYLNGYGIAYCYLSEDKNEIIQQHDKMLKEWAEDQNTKDRAKILNKLIASPEPEKSKLEVEAVTWLKGLSKKELTYVKWIKNYYEDLK